MRDHNIKFRFAQETSNAAPGSKDGTCVVKLMQQLVTAKYIPLRFIFPSVSFKTLNFNASNIAPLFELIQNLIFITIPIKYILHFQFKIAIGHKTCFNHIKK